MTRYHSVIETPKLQMQNLYPKPAFFIHQTLLDHTYILHDFIRARTRPTTTWNPLPPAR